jgi:hypothetical protein
VTDVHIEGQTWMQRQGIPSLGHNLKCITVHHLLSLGFAERLIL